MFSCTEKYILLNYFFKTCIYKINVNLDVFKMKKMFEYYLYIFGLIEAVLFNCFC